MKRRTVAFRTNRGYGLTEGSIVEHEHPHSHTHAPGSSTGDLCCPVLTDVWVVKADAERDGLVRDYQGDRYYFCCGTCLTDFDANPTLYTH